MSVVSQLIKYFIYVKDWNEWHIDFYEKFPCSNIEEVLNRE